MKEKFGGEEKRWIPACTGMTKRKGMIEPG
jgi:hypothetical protein